MWSLAGKISSIRHLALMDEARPKPALAVFRQHRDDVFIFDNTHRDTPNNVTTNNQWLKFERIFLDFERL